MRSILLGFALIITAISTASADPPTFQAGVTRLKVQDATPFEALVAYPTHAPEAAIEDGPFKLHASRDAAIAAGDRFPVVLYSHGGGGPGTPLVSGDLLLHLARQGFIVIAPFHPGTERPFADRPRQMHKALDSVLADPRFSNHADPDRIGMMGFSFGGAVSLIVAGANLDLAHLSAYCQQHSEDTRACTGIATDGSWAKVPPGPKSDDALPLKALVLLDPYGAPLARKGLGSLDLPILIYTAAQSDLRAEGNAVAVAQALPKPPEQRAVPGSHFVFVDPCSPDLAARAPEICSDPPGTDRAAIHQRLRQEISAFLRAHL